MHEMCHCKLLWNVKTYRNSIANRRTFELKNSEVLHLKKKKQACVPTGFYCLFSVSRKNVISSQRGRVGQWLSEVLMYVVTDL